MKIQILNRWAACIYEAEVKDDDPAPLKTAVERAVRDGARLDGASLDRANLVGASLDRANLDRANLDGASLDRANLDGASLDRANLVGASLDRASLDGASLVGASLDRASLVGARLVGARLDRANLGPIKADLRMVLDAAPAEVAGLLQALRDGRVDGSTYQGECACLVGTIANVRGTSHTLLGARLRPDSSRPAERWFLSIERGHTPATNPVAAITERWIVEWQEDRAAALRPYADLLRALRAEVPGRTAEIDALIDPIRSEARCPVPRDPRHAIDDIERAAGLEPKSEG